MSDQFHLKYLQSNTSHLLILNVHRVEMQLQYPLQTELNRAKFELGSFAKQGKGYLFISFFLPQSSALHLLTPVVQLP